MKLEKNSNLSEPVYIYLRDMILSLQVKPGEKIPETKIATQFGISRTPIREALRRLANEGLVKIYPNRFAEVSVFDEEYVKHLGLVRLSLDTLAVRLAIYYGSNADFDRLKQCADLCLEAAQRSDTTTQIKLDTEFHMEITRISKNPIIEKYQSQIFLQIELLLACKYASGYEVLSNLHMHEDLVDAMIARDEKRAIELITQHLLSFYQLKDNFPFLSIDQL